MKKINLFQKAACAMGMLLTIGCTDLEETTYSELSESNFYKTELDYEQIKTGVYLA